MVECKVGRLLTEFTPHVITLLVELVPLGEGTFDEPVDNAASKLDAVANYARTTFGVRTSPVPAPNTSSQGNSVPKSPKDRKADRFSKNMEQGTSRAIQVLEDELSKAKESGDPRAVKQAEEQLKRAQELVSKRE